MIADHTGDYPIFLMSSCAHGCECTPSRSQLTYAQDTDTCVPDHDALPIRECLPILERKTALFSGIFDN